MQNIFSYINLEWGLKIIFKIKHQEKIMYFQRIMIIQCSGNNFTFYVSFQFC